VLDCTPPAYQAGFFCAGMQRAGTGQTRGNRYPNLLLGSDVETRFSGDRLIGDFTESFYFL
jgi:hypothetical protein